MIDNITIECECNCVLMKLGFMSEFDEFYLSIYHKGFIKKKRLVHEVIISKEKAKEMMEFISNNVMNEDEVKNELYKPRTMESVQK